MQATAVERTPGAGATRSRRGVTVVAVVVLAAFVAGGSLWTVWRTENDLTTRSQAALTAAGIAVTVHYQGLDAVLTGTVTGGREAADAIGVVAEVAGTRHVSSQLGFGTTAFPEAPTTSGEATDPAAGPPGVTLPSGTITFATNDARLSAGVRTYLATVASFLVANPGVLLVVKGHSDNVGTDEVNWALSKQRAAAVAGYLQSRGVPPDRLRTEAFAATTPVAPNDTPQGRAANRRVELAIEEAP